MESTFEGNTCFSETCSVLGLGESDQKISSGTPRVLLILASLLETSIRKNEMLSRTEDHNVTKFNSSKAPVLSVMQYIERISKYTNCSMSCFIVAYIYIQRYMITRSGVCLTSLNIHRLMITSTMIAAKFLDDECESNAHYALVGGVSTREMNELEIELLFGLEFRLQVTTEVFAQYCQYIQHTGSRRGRRECQVDPPQSRCQRGRILISRAAKYKTTQGCIAQ